MNDSKNLILAVVLSALVLLGWSWAANKFFPTANPPSTKIEAGKQQPVQQPSAQPSAPATPKATMSVAAALGSSQRVAIRTPSLSGSINLKGAQIDDLVLLDQRQTIAKNSPPVRLFSPLGAPGAYLASFGWTAQNGAGSPTFASALRQCAARRICIAFSTCAVDTSRPPSSRCCSWESGIDTGRSYAALTG